MVILNFKTYVAFPYYVFPALAEINLNWSLSTIRKWWTAMVYYLYLWIRWIKF